MADTKITALTAITSITPATFPLPIVDLLDTTMAGSGTTKKVTVNQILGCGGTATLASATITGDLTVDTSTLKVDSANDRVGIGTATPGGALEVFKNTNGQNRLFLNNPNTGTGAYDAIDFTAGTANNQILSMGSGYSGSFPYLTGALLLRSAQANGIVLNTAGSAAAIQFGINDTLGMTLNATGLGVGLVPANDKLSVSQTIGLVTSTTADVNFRNIGNTTIQRIRYDDSTGTLTIGSALGTAYPVQIGGNTTTRAVTIDGSSNVGIGVTPVSGQKLTVLTNAGISATTATAADDRLIFTENMASANLGSQIVWKNSGNGNAYASIGFTNGAAGNNGSLIFSTSSSIFGSNNVERMRIDSAGNPIFQPSATPATLGTNGMLTVNATSNTNLRFSYRGSDGVTRVANITLA